MIAHWPAGIAARGELRPQTGHLIDFMPTLLELAGGTYPAQRNGVAVQPMEGVSLVPAFANRGVARAAPLFFEHDGSRGVRDGNWKLVSTVGDAWELYNLASDPTEMKNLAGVQPERVRDLAAQWTAWAKRTHVDPTTNPFTAGPGAPKQKKAKGKAE
jgi:arylsulfatase